MQTRQYRWILEMEEFGRISPTVVEAMKELVKIHDDWFVDRRRYLKDQRPDLCAFSHLFPLHTCGTFLRQLARRY